MKVFCLGLLIAGMAGVAGAEEVAAKPAAPVISAELQAEFYKAFAQLQNVNVQWERSLSDEQRRLRGLTAQAQTKVNALSDKLTAVCGAAFQVDADRLAKKDEWACVPKEKK